jgi:plasmid stabilization system protein ParE
MANSLLILSAAERDVSDAFAWYENRQSGLGLEFLRAVDARIRTIQRTPEACGFIANPYRSAIVRRFPYVVLYTYRDNTVTIYAVFHTSQDPQKWRARLPRNPYE